MDRQTPKGSNQEQLAVMEDVLKVVKPDETVYDMVGSYVFRPDGYYICCHPYIQFADLLSRPIPALSESLIATKTKFLVMDQKGYVFWIAKPEDLAFMTTHYLPSNYNKLYTLGSKFQCNQGVCQHVNVHGQPVPPQGVTSFDIVIGELYKLSMLPNDQWVKIGNRVFSDTQTIQLNPGTYEFSVSPNLSSFSIQLKR